MNKFMAVFLAGALLFSMNGSVFADTVYLLNGDKLHGKIVSENEGSLTLSSEYLGELTIEKARILKVKADKKEAITKAKETAATSEIPWARKISAGYSVKAGNTEEEDMKLAFNANKKWEKARTENKISIDYGESNGRVDTQKWYGASKFSYLTWETERDRLNERFLDHFKAEQIDTFAKVELDHDKFADIDYRLVPTLGLTYWFEENETFKAKLDVGFGLTRTKYSSGKSSTTDPTIIPTLYLEKKLFGKAILSEELVFYPSIADMNDYRFVSTTKFSNPITDNLSIEMALIDEYDNTSGRSVEKNDLQFISGLSYSF